MRSYVVRNESGKEFNVDEAKISDAEKDGFLPVVSNGKESHRVSFDDMKLANKDGFNPISPKQEQRDGSKDPLIEKVMGKIDSYTGGPVRAAIGELQAGNSIGDAGSAYANKFGDRMAYAPSGKELAQKAGVPDTALSEVQPSDFASGAPINQGETTGQKVGRYGKMAIGALMGKPPELEELMPGQFARNNQGEVKARKGGFLDTTASGAAGLGIDIATDPTTYTGYLPIKKTIGAVASGIGKVARVIPGVEAAESIVKGGAQVVKDSGEAVKKMFTLDKAKDLNELSQIADKNGIDKSLFNDAVTYGEDSIASRAQRHKAEGVLGQKELEKYNAGIESVQKATDKKIADLAGGSVPTKVEAGEVIRQGYDKGVEKLFNDVGMTHNKVVEAIPGLKLSPEAMQNIGSKLDGMEKWAKGREVRGFTQADRTQASQVLKAIEAVREGNGSYKQTVETLRDIGDTAFKSKNVLADIPPDIAKFRDLYSTINEGLIDTVGKAAGQPVADELIRSNKMIHEFLGDKSVVSSVIGNKNIGAEKVFESLMERGDTRKIQALKNILPAEDFQKLKGAFLESQLKRAEDGSFSFKGLQNNLSKKSSVVGEIFKPDEIKDVADLTHLGTRFGDPVLSSGTGASIGFSNIPKAIGHAIENESIINYLKKGAEARDAVAKSGFAGKVAGPGSAAYSAMKEAATSYPAAKKAFSLLFKDGDPGDLKGESKWAVSGLNNLIEHDKSGVLAKGKTIEELLSTKKGKQLLISASDLKPGSKAMDKLLQDASKLND